jgi:hypothetical protein
MKICLNQTHQISSTVYSVISPLLITGPRHNEFKKIKEWISSVERLSQDEAYESLLAVLVAWSGSIGLHIASVENLLNKYIINPITRQMIPNWSSLVLVKMTF